MSKRQGSDNELLTAVLDACALTVLTGGLVAVVSLVAGAL